MFLKVCPASCFSLKNGQLKYFKVYLMYLKWQLKHKAVFKDTEVAAEVLEAVLEIEAVVKGIKVIRVVLDVVVPRAAVK